MKYPYTLVKVVNDVMTVEVNPRLKPKMGGKYYNPPFEGESIPKPYSGTLDINKYKSDVAEWESNIISYPVSIKSQIDAIGKGIYVNFKSSKNLDIAEGIEVDFIEIGKLFVFNAGNYHYTCSICNDMFIGNKRQPICEYCCGKEYVFYKPKEQLKSLLIVYLGYNERMLGKFTESEDGIVFSTDQEPKWLKSKENDEKDKRIKELEGLVIQHLETIIDCHLIYATERSKSAKLVEFITIVSEYSGRQETVYSLESRAKELIAEYEQEGGDNV